MNKIKLFCNNRGFFSDSVFALFLTSIIILFLGSYFSTSTKIQRNIKDLQKVVQIKDQYLLELEDSFYNNKSYFNLNRNNINEKDTTIQDNIKIEKIIEKKVDDSLNLDAVIVNINFYKENRDKSWTKIDNLKVIDIEGGL